MFFDENCKNVFIYIVYIWIYTFILNNKYLCMNQKYIHEPYFCMWILFIFIYNNNYF